MYAELFFYVHLHASMGSIAAAGWSRRREDTAAQCDSLCSAASTVSSLSMLLCNDSDNSVSQQKVRGHASRRVFLLGVRPVWQQFWRQSQQAAIPGGSAAQPPLWQDVAGGQVLVYCGFWKKIK